MNARTNLRLVKKKISKKTPAKTGIHPRFIMLGGFLGAGKTTTLLKLALSLQRKGLRVGLITNDQAAGLVDSALAEDLDLPVREIAGGCFCCRSESLVEALDRLEHDSQPEVFLAEPVGSCTDLVATVSLPLERIYKKGFVMAPYTVVVDPYRAMQTLGVEGEPLFSADVNYIYRKQLEEAEIICINKVDVISPERLTALKKSLEREYPEARIMEIASREDIGLDSLFEILTTTVSRSRQTIELDYERYAIGEARLGWLNLQGSLEPVAAKKSKTSTKKSGSSKAAAARTSDAPPSFDGNEWLMSVAMGIAGRLVKRKIEVAHLKLSLATQDSEDLDLAAVQLVRSGSVPEATRTMKRPFAGGKLLINLRAEGDPDVLASETFGVLTAQLEKQPWLILKTVNTDHFRPGKPVPTHRVATA